MELTRRDFVKHAAAASSLAAVPVSLAAAQAPAPNPLPIKVGMTDWNLGRRGDITKIALAREIGLDGIQVSVQYPVDGSPTLRDLATQAEFKRVARNRISDMQPGVVSLMPAGFDEQLSRQELADLVAFLRASR